MRREGISRGTRAAALVVVLAVLALLAGPRGAAAHAAFERSDPAPNAILATSPAQVTIWFTEPLEMGYSSITLYDERGVVVPGLVSGPGPNAHALTLPIPTPLANGTYAVAFESLSAADGHGDSSYFAFTVGSATDVVAVVAPDGTAAGSGSLWAQTLGRWASLVGLIGAVAIWPIWVVVLRPAAGGIGPAGPRLARRTRRLAWLAVGLAVAGNISALLAQAQQLPAEGLGTRVRETLTETRYGELWALRIGLLALFAVALRLVSWWEPRRSGWRTGLALAAAALLPLPTSLNAHASALTTGRAAAIAADVVHVVAASLWAGGIALLLTVAVLGLRGVDPVARRGVLGLAIPRFSALALVAWGALALTGGYSAWLHVGNLTALRETDYGRSLTVKLLLLVPVLALAAFNLLVVSRRVGRADPTNRNAWARRLAAALSVEVALAVLVLLLVGRLTAQQPARDELARAGTTAPVVLPLAMAERSGVLTLSPGTAGPNLYQLTVDGDALPADTEAVLRIDQASGPLGQKEVALERTAGNGFETRGSELSTAGDWTIQVIVRKIGAFQYTGTGLRTIGLTPEAAALPGPAWRFETSAIAGLGFLVAGMAGWVIGWQAGRRPLRREAFGLGTVLAGMGVLLILAGRAPEAGAANPIPPDEASLARGSSTFAVDCASCHGVGGQGDGPAAAAMEPSPTNLTVDHGHDHTDTELFALIAEGKAGTGMPAYGDTLTDEEIWDVVNYVRGMREGG